MLLSLQLENYRCFRQHEIDFREMNIVVGANNAGKSTLVEALRLLGLIVGRYKGLSYGRPPAWTSLPRRSLGVSPAMGDLNLRGGSVFHRYGEPPAIIQAGFSNGTSVDVYVGPENSIFGLVYGDGRHLVSSRSDAKSLDIPNMSILPQIGPLRENEPLLSREYVLKSMETALASLHFRNQIYWLKKEHFDDFKRRAEESWRRLQLGALNIEGDPPDETLSFQVRDTNFVAEVGWMGHGLQMWLQTMWFLARSTNAETVILDEPDVYMHADLQRRLIRLLRNRVGQTIIATHSVEIMAEVAAEDILIVDKTRRRSIFAASLPAVQDTIDELGGVHNIHLARLWGARRCLYVEGEDVPFLKAFQDILYPNSDLPFDVIPRLSLGGWSGWPQAIGAARTMTNAAGDSIMSYCILDSDFHTAEEIDARYKAAAQYGFSLHVWKMKEIENYLLVPAAIERVIDEGVTRGGESPSLAQIETKIDEIAEDLKDDVFDALAHEYLILNRAAGVSAANRQARERLNLAWRSRGTRYRILPGKQVISRLSAWSKQSSGVSFGPMKIARALKASEISQEVKAVVRAIEHGEPLVQNPDS